MVNVANKGVVYGFLGKDLVKETTLDERYGLLQLNVLENLSDHLSGRQELDINQDTLILKCNPRFVCGRLQLYFERKVLEKFVL